MENETKLTEQILLEAKNKWMDRALLAEEKLKEFQEMSEFCGDGHINRGDPYPAPSKDGALCHARVNPRRL